jgi:glucokinase
MNKIDITVGVDIGGTNTAIGFVDRNGKCHSEGVISTNGKEEAVKFFSKLHEKIDNMYTELSEEFQLKGIGIGAPNANYLKGTIEYPPNLNWGYINVVEIMREYYNIPLAITNDANAAAIGEMKFGAAKGMKDFIVITLGTGLGSGIVVNGELVYGADGFAGEIGHTIYDPCGRECGCGRKGCLETYASASGIRRTVLELLNSSNEESELRNISSDEITSKIIFDAAVKGDKIALEAFEFTGKVLGTKLADSVAYTSPEAIILFGGLAAAGDLIFKPVKYYMEQNLLNIFRNKVKIIPAGLSKGNSAVLGASALIWNELDKLFVT